MKASEFIERLRNQWTPNPEVLLLVGTGKRYELVPSGYDSKNTFVRIGQEVKKTKTVATRLKLMVDESPNELVGIQMADGTVRTVQVQWEEVADNE